ncbi:MAG TPA: heavy-metal-associated domain-containing protein [Eudoraea sp.]|nr:heavy-metal-associated domain-containing protein [Eudoraea sp.]
MNKLLIILFIGLSVISGRAQDGLIELKGTIKIEVDGLSCPFCAYGLEKNLKKLEGVETIKIDVENAFVLLTIAEGKSVDEATIRENIKDAGFTPRAITKDNDG